MLSARDPGKLSRCRGHAHRAVSRRVYLLPFRNNRAGVRLVKPGEDLYQGGLARAVIADQCQHLSLTELDAHIDERGDGAEGLADVAHFEDDRGFRVESGNTLRVHMRLRARSRSTWTFSIIAARIPAPR